MPKDFRPTALERAVGRKLSRWRDERDLSLFEAGRRVGFSSAKLSMMENAIQPSAIFDVMALGYVYKVPTAEWQHLISQAQHAADLRKSGHPRAPVFDPAEDFPFLITDATRLRVFAVDAPPTIFQLAEYTTATMSDNLINIAQLTRTREAWATRAAGSEPVPVEAVLTEATVRGASGNQRAMRAQLLHLMEMSKLPEVSLRVVPQSVTACPAMNFSFTWLSFAHRQHDDVVYTETFLRSEYVETRAQVERVADRFSALQALTLDEGDSLELIAGVAARMSQQ
ncbi:helix-turn-helix transcriptional regulator [Lentzea sp. HUAS12]|uniref:helix-turn-helix domain-containing protein n=1 Tax=Lentzea sp. HUAS12 TaxID=2951806 RepID=UPI00209DEA61|nr:helix-turn-helix transcriptional regulator [Lentzea sp. HUAS12]USX54130.1 helix-turn-helix domain-containing protein [Lentzea sp. HUAS12]